MRRTGGGVDFVQDLTLLDQRVVAVMGGQSFATGDSGLAVDPFPQNTPHQSSSIVDPSASSAAPAVPMDFIVVPHMEETRDPASQQAEAEETRPRVEERPQDETGHRGTLRARRLNNQDRPSRSVTFLDTQVRRFEEIESRRVEAEMQTAQALSQIAAAIMEMVTLLRAYLERDHPAN